MKRMRTRLAIGAGAALAVVGGGAAYAAGHPKPTPEKRVDEAVAAGRLSAERGDELKARIRAGELPLLGLRGGRHGLPHRRGVGLDAAASYLGLTAPELRTELRDGNSLADVARAEGKSVQGLVDTLVAAAKARLDGAVEAGRLTETQRDEMLERLETRIEEGVNASGFRPRAFRGRHGPPPAGDPGHRLGGGAEPPAAA